jgi:hypothetical protein
MVKDIKDLCLDMAKDIKDLCFGYGGDKDYKSCHRGISPFVVPVLAAAASAQHQAQDMLSRVSHLISMDAQDLETSPGSYCSMTYDAIQMVLLTSLQILLEGHLQGVLLCTFVGGCSNSEDVEQEGGRILLYGVQGCGDGSSVGNIL